MSRRWYQFNLKSLMVFVVVICLGLGGWHLLMTYGQFIEAETAVVGQPIKIRGRFFDFSGSFVNRAEEDELACNVEIDPMAEGFSWTLAGVNAKSVGWWQYDVAMEIESVDEPTAIRLVLHPYGGRPIHGKLVVRPANVAW